jgi:cytochrome c peroxidase
MMHKIALAVSIPALLAGIVLAACAGGGQDQKLTLPGDPKSYGPLEKMENMKVPETNAITQEKATLGWILWFDKRLSGDGSRACYSCHVNEKGLTDGMVKNTNAVDGKPLARHTPTLWNIGYHQNWYWDGRAATLEGQALAAWKLANMGAKDKEKDEIRADVIERINSVAAYKDLFQKAFGAPANEKNVVQALATFMRTIISKDTDWDRYQKGDKKAVSEAAVRGWDVFQRAECNKSCHNGFLFTDLQFHNVGVGLKDGKPADVGRQKVTSIDKDTGAFKTPTLRDVARSAPYFHDGSVATLEEAVKFMLGGGGDNPYLDKANLQKKDLKPAEIADMIEFLKSLTEHTTIPEPKVP